MGIRDVARTDFMSKQTVPELNAKEMAAANECAEVLRTVADNKRGLYIWEICNEYDVDHHKIARHLAQRANSRRAKNKL